MSESTKKISSVFTKGQVRDILMDVKNNYGMNCPLNSQGFEAYLDEIIVRNTPGSRGRKAMPDEDIKALQATLESAVTNIVGTKASVLVLQAISLFNTRKLAKGVVRSTVAPTQVKLWIEKGKLTLPAGFVYDKRPRKATAAAPPTPSSEPETVSI